MKTKYISPHQRIILNAMSYSIYFGFDHNDLGVIALI